MKHILIVEDDNLLNKTLTYNLELDGYTITSVLNARTAAVGRFIGLSAFDGIAIHQRQKIRTGSIDNVAVGSIF